MGEDRGERPRCGASAGQPHRHHPLQREGLVQLLAAEEFGVVIERPAQQGQVVVDGPGKVADVAVEIDDHRIEGVGFGGEPNS